MLVSSVSTIHASVGDKTTARDVESLLLTYLNSLDNTIALQEDTVSVSNLMYAEMLCQSQEWVLLYFNEVSLSVDDAMDWVWEFSEEIGELLSIRPPVSEHLDFFFDELPDDFIHAETWFKDAYYILDVAS